MAAPGAGTSRIGVGDLLALTISSGHTAEPIEPVNVRVSPSGQVNVPLVGLVPVAGMEPFEAEQQIAAAAVQREVYRQPSVTLQVTERAVNRVTVLGAVTNPGVHELPRGSSDLVGALASAGGLTEEAGTKVDVLRHSAPSFLAGPTAPRDPAQNGIALASYDSEPWSPPGVTTAVMPVVNGAASAPQTVRLDLAQAESAIGPNYALSDRDVVMVLPEEERFIHVSGLVRKADRFELPRNQEVRLLDAIAMAGGVSSPVADKALIIRRMPNMSESATIQVSIGKAKRDGNENLRLAAGDMVSVETTAATAFVDTATNLFRMTLGIGGNLATF
jgi:polysaccharide export outer membrane protein